MSNIYTTSFIDGPELNPTNLLESFEDYAEKLEEVAKDYKKLAKFIRSKNIKILEAHGHTHGGFFRVDEIDTNRLKKAGFVIDFSEVPEEEDPQPVFYIDSELEEAMVEFVEELEEKEAEETDLLSSILEPDFEAPESFEIEVEGEPFSSKETIFSIKDVLTSYKDDDPKIGKIGVEVQHIADTKFDFNIGITDLNKNPIMMQFDREKCIFKYQCGSCDSWHYETLESVYRSLKTANALLSNLMEMAGGCKEMRAAFDFIDHDLRLIQALLRFDYALEDEDE